MPESNEESPRPKRKTKLTTRGKRVILASALVLGGAATEAKIHPLEKVGQVFSHDKRGDIMREGTYEVELKTYPTGSGDILSPVFRDIPDKNDSNVFTILELQDQGYRIPPSLEGQLVFGSPYEGPSEGQEKKQADQISTDWNVPSYWDFPDDNGNRHGAWLGVQLKNTKGEAKTFYGSLNFFKNVTPDQPVTK